MTEIKEKDEEDQDDSIDANEFLKKRRKNQEG